MKMSDAGAQEVETHSPEETFEFGFKLACRLASPKNILLYGDLGMGKTVLAKGIICGLGVEDRDEVVSPSFTLIQEYRINDRVIQHVDLYRLDSAREIEALGLEEMLNDDRNYVVVEWADKLPFVEIPRALRIEILDRGENNRALRMESL